MKKNIIITLVIIAVAGTVAALYFYNKPVASTAGKSADTTINSIALFDEFSADEAQANTSYLDKVISVSGTITDITTEDGHKVITLNTGSPMAGVVCQMENNDDKVNSVTPGSSVIIKGVCTGMLMDVIMVRCVITE